MKESRRPSSPWPRFIKRPLSCALAGERKLAWFGLALWLGLSAAAGEKIRFFDPDDKMELPGRTLKPDESGRPNGVFDRRGSAGMELPTARPKKELRNSQELEELLKGQKNWLMATPESDDAAMKRAFGIRETDFERSTKTEYKNWLEDDSSKGRKNSPLDPAAKNGLNKDSKDLLEATSRNDMFKSGSFSDPTMSMNSMGSTKSAGALTAERSAFTSIPNFDDLPHKQSVEPTFQSADAQKILGSNLQGVPTALNNAAVFGREPDLTKKALNPITGEAPASGLPGSGLPAIGAMNSDKARMPGSAPNAAFIIKQTDARPLTPSSLSPAVSGPVAPQRFLNKPGYLQIPHRQF